MEVRIDESTRAPRTEEAGGFDLNGGERWFVVQTLQHREKLAQLHLRLQGFRSFFPRFCKTVRHARKLRDVVVPVFRGYMFVIFDTDRDRWRSINGTLGVARLLTADSQPVPVPAGVVEALIGARDSAGHVLLGADLKPGDAVRIVAGPFAGGLGELERLDAKGRVRVLLNIIGGQAALVIDRAHLAAA